MGTCVDKGETAMDTHDWRAQLPSGGRQKVVNKIMEALHKYLRVSGPEEMNELRKIASRFEEKIFSDAVNLTDYLRKISIKMLPLDTKAPNAAGSSLPIPGGYNRLPLNPGCHQMTVEGPVEAEPVVNTGDWRTCLPPDSRKKNANKIKGTLKEHVPNCGKEGDIELKKIAASFEELIFNTAIDQFLVLVLFSARRNSRSPKALAANLRMATLMKHLPYSGPEGINELKRIAVRFEEKVFSSSVHQNDYLRKISMKMLTMETKSQNVAGSASSIPADSSNLAFDELNNLMINNGNVEPFLLNEEPAIKSGDWRTQLPPGSRQNIVNKIMDTLKKHFPYSGPEGINELKRIAARFEEKIFSSAVHQTDYLRKISMKILTMETKAQNAAGSDSSILADSNNLTLDDIMNHLIKDNAEPSLLNVEPAINSGDWRIQLPPDSRQKNIDKLTEALKKQHLPFSGPEGVNEHSKIASRFEDKVFNTAANLNDYLRKISLEVLTIENTVKNAADPAGKANVDVGSLMDNNSLRPSYLPNRESAVDTGDWRAQLPPATRKMIVNNITDTLVKHHSGTERSNERRGFAARLEENIFNSADHQVIHWLYNINVYLLDLIHNLFFGLIFYINIQIDYLRQISAKISLLAASNSLPLDLGHLGINRGDWRTQHPPGSRQKNVNKLLETLKKHVPYSGKEGIEELMRIAVSFEELIFNTARNQIKTIQEAYLPDLAVIYQRAASRVQQMGSLPRQRRSEQFEKLKQFKAAVERMILFLSVSKRDVIPALRDKVAIYEKQTIDLVNMLRPRNPVQQGELPQQSSHVVFSSQGQQSQNQPSQQQLMMPLQSHHQQLQQPNLLQRLQSSGQFTGSLLPPQNVVDQQRQTLPEIPSSLLNSMAQTESGNAVDWQEEVYQKIKTLRDTYLSDLKEVKQRVAAKLQQIRTINEKYLAELHEIYQRASAKLEKQYSLPQQQRLKDFEKLKQFKIMLERMIRFLLISKSNIMPALKDKVDFYETQIISFLNRHRPRKPVQQGQLPQPQNGNIGINRGDWRTQHPPGSRQKNVNTL
uniref:Mediator complex subunit 15 KIX domain-containing protein n=1 Tax=Brassica campestris TaxID=3711 RepID=M4EBE6_BRACM